MSRSRPKRRTGVQRAVKIGVPPGTPVYVGVPRETRIAIHLMDYDGNGVREEQQPKVELLAQCRKASTVTWLDLDGVHDPTVVQKVGELFDLHPLWVEDILNPTSRPKVEWLADRLFVILRVVTVVAGELVVEQVALVLGPGFVLSFQETPGDVWEPVRDRIRQGIGKIRMRGPDVLLHALTDAVVDAYFEVLRTLDHRIDRLESDALVVRDPELLRRIAGERAEVDLLRGAIWPLREAVANIIGGEDVLIEARTIPFFRDLGDHLATLVDDVELLRDRLRGAVELHLAMSSHQLNDVIRVLTLFSTMFMPLTFVVGVYGMNFEFMPELHWRYGYPAVIAGMVAIVIGMFVYFKRRRWL